MKEDATDLLKKLVWCAGKSLDIVGESFIWCGSALTKIGTDDPAPPPEDIGTDDPEPPPSEE